MHDTYTLVVLLTGHCIIAISINWNRKAIIGQHIRWYRL